MKLEPVLKRFEDKYIPEPMSGCWLWLGADDGQCGYGVFIMQKKEKMRAHRAAWVLYRGTIPDGCEVCHTCDVPACVNPDHLFLGTHTDNMRDMKRKGRWNGTFGDTHHAAKMTAQDVKDMRELRAKGWSEADLSVLYGIGKSMTNYICNGTYWRHVQ